MFASGFIYNHHQDKPDPYLEENEKERAPTDQYHSSIHSDLL
jgi:hypothetical protein